MSEPLRIVYCGTADFAVTPLERLITDPRRFEVIAVVSQPDKPVGRAGTVQSSPVATLARQRRLLLLQPERIRGNENFLAKMTDLAPDFLVVAAYGQILPSNLLAVPKRGSLNLHGSLLPKYRGASPIQAAILDGGKETGVSLMLMDAALDHGPVYTTVTETIGPADTYGSLAHRLSLSAATLLTDNLEAIAAGRLTPVEQDHAAATFTHIIAKQEGQADWLQESAERLERKLRAFTPWPGLFTFWQHNGKPMRLKIIEARAIVSEASLPPGTAFVTPDGWPAVAATQGALALTQVQPEGKSALDGHEFVRGYRDFVGSVMTPTLVNSPSPS